MKLVRYGPPGREKPGIVDAKGRIRDLSKIVPDIAGDALSPEGPRQDPQGADRQAAAGRRAARGSGACVGGTGNFIAIGLNYSDHAAEAGMAIPKEPIIFNKAPSCIVGPNDDTMIPKASTKLDWEVRARHRDRPARALLSSKAKALDVVAGYCLATTCPSASSRSSAPGSGPRARAAETFGPLGPWLVTKDEIKDPQDLDMWLDVNGDKRQRGNTKTMIFDCRAHRLVLLAVSSCWSRAT